MADLPPPITPSPAAAISPGAAAAPAPPIAATIVTLPDNLAQLVRQVDIAATLAMIPTGPTVSLTTAQGPLTVSLSNLASNQQQAATQQLLALFDAQKPLTLIVNPGSPPTQAFLFLPQNSGTSAPITPALLPVTSQAPPAILLMPTTPQPVGPIAVGSAVTATVLPSGLSFPATAPSAPATPAVTNTAPLILPSVNANAAASLQTPASPLIAPAQNQSPPPSLPLNLLQAGNDVTLNIAAIAPPNMPAPLSTLPNQAVATVIGNGANGQLIVKIGDTHLFVKQPSDLPVGSQLLVTVTAAKDSAPITLPPAASNFPSLQQSIATLMQIDPQLGQQFLQNQLPQPANAFPASLLFMMTAMKQGNVRGWLGDDAVDAFARAGKFELLGDLVRETAQPGQVAQDGVVGQWQSYPVPVFAQSQLQIMSLYVHMDPDQPSSGKAGMKAGSFTRFIIDVNFSKIGPMQLDGFVQARKLDMIVRSEKALPDGLAPELRDSYRLAMESIGFAGSLSFQFGRQGWLSFQNNRAGTAVVT